MKTSVKALLICVCALALVAASIFGTMAYLTDTQSVTNTFTVGKVDISLDEAKVTEYGVKDGDTRVQENEYKLIPGREYVKDPIVHVNSESESCWLFVKVENGIKDIETDTTADTIASQISANGWNPLENVTNVYYKEYTKGGNTEFPVFSKFVIAGEKVVHTPDADDTIKTGEIDIEGYKDAKVIVTAYAMQKDGFDTAAAAWTASKFN